MTKPILAVMVSLCLLGGCAAKNIERSVTTPNSGVYKISMQPNDLVTFKKGDVEFSVDGKKSPSLFETVLTMGLTKTEFNLSNKEGK